MVSIVVRHLLDLMMNDDEENRPTPQKVLSHSWTQSQKDDRILEDVDRRSSAPMGIRRASQFDSSTLENLRRASLKYH